MKVYEIFEMVEKKIPNELNDLGVLSTIALIAESIIDDEIRDTIKKIVREYADKIYEKEVEE